MSSINMTKGAAPVSGDDKDDATITLGDRVIAVDDMKHQFSTYGHYADMALAVTMRDLAGSKHTLDLNERPAFVQNPKKIVLLFPEKSKDQLITRILEQYW